MNTLGNNIKRLREQRGWLQAQLAERIGVTPGAISGWENGTRNPEAQLRQKLCEVFGITESELFSEGGHPDLPKQVVELLQQPEIIEALKNPAAVRVLLAVNNPDATTRLLREVISAAPIDPDRKELLLTLAK